MELFVPHVFFPKWDEKCEQAVLDFLDVVMSQTPIYLLCCRPDEEAVELTEGRFLAGTQGRLTVNPMKSDRSQVRDLKGQVSFYGREVVPLIREVLASGGSFDLTVSGTSMSPTLKPERDQVRLKAPQRKMPEKYPILFFQRDDGTYVLHRKIRGGRQGIWVINGDAQAWTECIQPGQVIGVVYEIRRKGRWIR